MAFLSELAWTHVLLVPFSLLEGIDDTVNSL